MILLSAPIGELDCYLGVATLKMLSLRNPSFSDHHGIMFGKCGIMIGGRTRQAEAFPRA
ncbi:hypothetical protein KX729_29660 [Rhizobium sp. XQZ8]|uniref:hypothetical protein n=1 Tax=Rhizobium populisoli TaxID=2859785 RepID=UPI001CA4E885|nr:hypothetical protein [Rhizobium populisoli]MBW6425578.1 hypothetical protein [Rhizobium populisoli]